MRALQHSRRSAPEPGSVLTQLISVAASFHSDQLNFLIFQEIVEDSDSIRPSAYARNDRGRKFSFRFQNLRPRLPPMTRWKSRTIVG